MGCDERRERIAFLLEARQLLIATRRMTTTTENKTAADIQMPVMPA
jgi:hypothetical protein